MWNDEPFQNKRMRGDVSNESGGCAYKHRTTAEETVLVFFSFSTVRFKIAEFCVKYWIFWVCSHWEVCENAAYHWRTPNTQKWWTLHTLSGRQCQHDIHMECEASATWQTSQISKWGIITTWQHIYYIKHHCVYITHCCQIAVFSNVCWVCSDLVTLAR